MTKKLLPTMIGVILAGGVAVAQADVQVFGHIDEALAYVNGGRIHNSGLGGTGVSNNFYPNLVAKGDNNTQLVCTDCSIGFKGSEDLGNGLKALFFLDWTVDINNSTTPDGRDQWLGMGGNFGTLKAGTMSTVYKSYGAKFDPVYYTIAQQRNIGIQSNLHNEKGDVGQGRATNTVGYDSPDWNGLKLNATYTIQPDSAQPRTKGPYSGGVSYENGGFLVNAAYISNNSGGDDAAASLGAKFTLNNFAVFGQYEKDLGLITDSVTGTLGQSNDGDGADVWMVGGTYTMGNNMLYAGYGQGDNASTTDASLGAPPPNVGEPSYKSWELVGVHNFSKRTLAYVGYIGSKPDGNVNTGNGTGSHSVDDLAVFTVGAKHTF